MGAHDLARARRGRGGLPLYSPASPPRNPMRAAVLRAYGQPLEVEDVELDAPGPHELRVRTVACGICHSDLHVQKGTLPAPLPTVLGHEAAGIVEEVGSSVTQVKPGDRVIACVSVFCGHCEFCLSGRPNL